MRSGHSSYGRSFPALAGNDLRPDHHEIVGEAERHGAAVRTMHLHVGSVVDVAIRRQAGATFVHGDFEVFRVQRPQSARAGSPQPPRTHVEPGSGSVNEAPKRPIQIQLADAGVRRRPKQPVKCSRNSTVAANHVSYAVMHRNPYLHVALTDDTDGSNYDLFVTRPDTIELHPGFRASLGSLTRLSQQFGDRFEAVALGEEPAQAPDVVLRPHRRRSPTDRGQGATGVAKQHRGCARCRAAPDA